MFVIVYNNTVILGPMVWNRFRFENTIFEECDNFSVTLENRNDSLSPVIVSENIKILPIQGTENPIFNSKIERLHGPFWEFTDSAAISSYTVEPLPIEAVKNQLKAVVAHKRYTREVSGVKVTIQNLEINADTTRENRHNVLQQYILMGDNDTIQWKYNDIWLTLNKAEVEILVKAVANHVQAQFDWESSKNQEIVNANSLTELDSIILE